MANLRKIIQGIGLSEKESRVYLACLESGPAKASTIAKKCGLNRVTTYDILKKLIERGVVSLVLREGSRIYSPIEPKQFVNRAKERVKNLEKALPILNKLTADGDTPKIEYFEGIEGIKQVYADTLTAKTTILNYADSRLVREIWPEYDEEYVSERVKKKIHLKGIAPYDEYGVDVARSNRKNCRDIRLVKGSHFDFSNEINIYDDKVAIISLKGELIGLIIENEDIANTQRSIFKMAWEFVKMVS